MKEIKECRATSKAVKVPTLPLSIVDSPFLRKPAAFRNTSLIFSTGCQNFVFKVIDLSERAVKKSSERAKNSAPVL